MKLHAGSTIPTGGLLLPLSTTTRLTSPRSHRSDSKGSVQAEQIISKTSSDDLPLTYRRVRASDIQNTVSPDQIPLLSQPTRVAIPNFSYIRNKRDNDLETTKGNYTTIDGGVADSHFGSETDFGRLLIQNSTYYSIGRKRNSDQKFVLARSTRIGIETPFGNTFMPQPGAECDEPQPGQPACLPLAERFFAGGGNSLRGFGLNQAGPRDPITGLSAGRHGAVYQQHRTPHASADLAFLPEQHQFCDLS